MGPIAVPPNPIIMSSSSVRLQQLPQVPTRARQAPKRQRTAGGLRTLLAFMRTPRVDIELTRGMLG